MGIMKNMLMRSEALPSISITDKPANRTDPKTIYFEVFP